MFSKFCFKANKSAGLLFSLSKPETRMRCLKKKNSSTLIAAVQSLVCGTSIRKLTLSSRCYSTKPPEFPSTPAPRRSKYKDKRAYTVASKAAPETDIMDTPLLDQSNDFLKNVRPITNEKQAKHDWIQGFLKSFPKNTGPDQLFGAFIKKLGYKSNNAKSYNHLVHVLSLNGEFRRAQSIFDLLKFNGLAPDERTYCALMNSYCNGGRLSKTIEIFELLRKDPKSKNPYPYAILIKAHMKHNRVQDAFDVLALMKQKMVPNTQVYTILIQACIKARDNSLAWAAYEMMLKDGVIPDERTYTMLIPICKKDDVKKALGLFEELLERGIQPSQEIINSILSALCSAPGYYSKAKELLNTLVNQGKFNPDVFTYNIMINGASISKNLTDARSFFLKLQQMKYHPKEQLVSYTSMFKAYATVFSSDRIERFIKLPAVSKKINDFSFLRSPTPSCIDDCVSEAMLLIHFSGRDAVSKEYPQFCNRLCSFFLSILANYNYFNEALKWFEIFAEKFNQHLHSHFYSCMLNMCTRLHKQDVFFIILGRAENLLAPIGPRSSLSEREKTEYKHTNLLNQASLESLYQIFILGSTQFGCLTEALDYFEIMASDLTIDWKKNGRYYKPFFKAIQDSSDSMLKLRLDRLLA